VHRKIALFLILSLVTSLGHLFHVQGSYDYLSYSASIDFETWFLDAYAKEREVFHANLNRTGWYLNGWNYTAEQYSKTGDRWALAEYTMSTILAYEITGNYTYFTEAVWLVDNYVTHDSEVLASSTRTWAMSPKTNPQASWAWAHHDSCIWFTMLKLNEYGLSYDVIDRLEDAIAVARYNNSTHLGWLYKYESQTDGYVANAFAPFILPLAYATYTSVKNYSSHVSRIYTALEEFRMANNLYKYKWTGPDIGQELYTMFVLRNLLMGEKWLPSVFNNTKIQQTIDALDGYSEMGKPAILPRGASVAIWAQGSGLTMPTLVQKACLQVHDVYNDNFDKKLAQKTEVVQSFWVISMYMSRVITDLALNSESSIATLTPHSIVHATLNYLYSSVVCKNDSYIHGGGSTLYFPYFSGNIGSRSHVGVAGWGSSSSWDSSNNYFVRPTNHTYDGATCSYQWDKYHKWFSFQANQSVSWRVLFIGGNFFDLWDWKIIHSNGTVTKLTDYNGTLQVTRQFAIQSNVTLNSKVFYLFNIDNDTLQQYTAGNYMWLWTELTQFTAYGRVLERLNPSAESEWDAVHTLLADGLTRLSNGASEPIANITVRQATQGWVIHSDSNISNYALGSDDLRFTLTGTGGTEQTVVHTGERGEPDNVAGASSWTFNSTTKMLTISTTGTEVIVNWTKKASGYFVMTVHVTEGGQPLSDVVVTVKSIAGTDFERVNATTDMLGLAQFELPYGTYLVQAKHEKKVKTLRLWLTGNKDVGLEFGNSSS